MCLALAPGWPSGPAQFTLFDIEYGRQEADTRRLATKDDVTRAYGTADWDMLDATIKQVPIDLRFRGPWLERS